MTEMKISKSHLNNSLSSRHEMKQLWEEILIDKKQNNEQVVKITWRSFRLIFYARTSTNNIVYFIMNMF